VVFAPASIVDHGLLFGFALVLVAAELMEKQKSHSASHGMALLAV
jgi:hypothetical protein